MRTQANARWLSDGTVRLPAEEVKAMPPTAMCFGNNVAFAKPNPKERTVGA
ncbi:MAG: hypothetical protein NW223_12075 [Hyphomicrobiaceae bacterium]|nr:hypothetical protein [Hyphomicrobiaceae bacterium]